MSEVVVGFPNVSSALKIKQTGIFTSSSYHILMKCGLPVDSEKFQDNIRQIHKDDNILLLQNRQKNGPVCITGVHAIQIPMMICKNENFSKNFDNVCIVLLTFNESSLSKNRFDINTNSTL